jgi:hypothetical protein
MAQDQSTERRGYFLEGQTKLDTRQYPKVKRAKAWYFCEVYIHQDASDQEWRIHFARQLHLRLLILQQVLLDAGLS